MPRVQVPFDVSNYLVSVERSARVGRVFISVTILIFAFEVRRQVGKEDQRRRRVTGFKPLSTVGNFSCRGPSWYLNLS